MKPTQEIEWLKNTEEPQEEANESLKLKTDMESKK